MATSRKIAYNTISQTIGRIIVAAISVITLRMLTNYFGVDTYGDIVAATTFIALFSTFTDWGLGVVTGREIAKYPEKARKIMGANLAMRLTISLGVAPLVALAGIAVYGNSKPAVAAGVVILSLTLVIGAIQAALVGIFVARVRGDIVAYIDVVTKVISVVGIYAIVVSGLGYEQYYALLVLLNIIGTILTLLVAMKFVAIKPNFDFTEWRRLFVLALPLGLTQIINMVYFKIDGVMISLYLSSADVGYYGVAYKIIELAMVIPSFFMVSMLPAMSTATTEKLKDLTQKALDAMITLAIPLFVGGSLMAPVIIVAVSSEEFLPAVVPFGILLFGAATTYVNAVYGNALVAISKQGGLVKLAIAATVLNISLNLFLIPNYGLNGAAFAVTITELFAMIVVAQIYRRATGIVLSYRSLYKVLLATTGMALVYLGLSYTGATSSSSLISVVLVGSVLGMSYFAILYLVKGIPEPLLKLLRR